MAGIDNVIRVFLPPGMSIRHFHDVLGHPEPVPVQVVRRLRWFYGRATYSDAKCYGLCVENLSEGELATIRNTFERDFYLFRVSVEKLCPSGHKHIHPLVCTWRPRELVPIPLPPSQVPTAEQTPPTNPSSNTNTTAPQTSGTVRQQLPMLQNAQSNMSNPEAQAQRVGSIPVSAPQTSRTAQQQSPMLQSFHSNMSSPETQALGVGSIPVSAPQTSRTVQQQSPMLQSFHSNMSSPETQALGVGPVQMSAPQTLGRVQQQSPLLRDAYLNMSSPEAQDLEVGPVQMSAPQNTQPVGTPRSSGPSPTAYMPGYALPPLFGGLFDDPPLGKPAFGPST